MALGPKWSGLARSGGEGGQRELGAENTYTKAEKQSGEGNSLPRDPEGDVPGGD